MEYFYISHQSPPNDNIMRNIDFEQYLSWLVGAGKSRKDVMVVRMVVKELFGNDETVRQCCPCGDYDLKEPHVASCYRIRQKDVLGTLSTVCFDNHSALRVIRNKYGCVVVHTIRTVRYAS
jgi:hypothetical protein